MEIIKSIKIVCPNCRSTKFKQEIIEIYYRYINEYAEIIEYEDDLTHDLDFGPILCLNCNTRCDSLFEDVEIQ